MDRKPPGSFEETSSYLESRINKSYLNSLSKKTFVDKLKKDYKFKINRIALDWFTVNTDTLIMQGLKKYERSAIPDGIIYSFTNQTLKNTEFADYIERHGTLILTRDSAYFIKTLLENSASDQLISYENSVLEKKYPEFRYLMNEFHDGILLFDISNTKIWNRINHDSLGLREYYEKNKYNFLSARQIEAKIYTLKTAGGEEALSSAYRKYSGKSDADKRLLEKFNKNKDTFLLFRMAYGAKVKIRRLTKLNGLQELISLQEMATPQ